MSITTQPVLTNAQASERAKHMARITKLARKLDIVLEDYNQTLSYHPRRIARALAEFNEAVAEAGTFRASLGECDPYPRLEIAIPAILEQDGAVFDAVYYDLDDLPRDA